MKALGHVAQGFFDVEPIQFWIQDVSFLYSIATTIYDLGQLMESIYMKSIFENR